MPSDFHSALESAAVALSRLDESLRRSPVAAGWEIRAQLHGACVAAGDEGFDVTPERLWPAAIAAPYPIERDYGALRRAQELYHIITILARRPPPWLLRGASDQPVRQELAEVHRLQRRIAQGQAGTLGIIAAATVSPDPNATRSYYRLAMAALCRRRGLLARIAPALFPRADPRASKTNVLARLASNSQRARLEILGLEASWCQARERIATAGKTALRQGAAIARLVDLLYAVEAVRPAWAGRLLGISEPQIGRMLARLAELDLAREISGRGTYRLWAAPDFEVIKRGRPIVAPRPSPAPPLEMEPLRTRPRPDPLPEIDWTPIFEEVDRAIRKAKQVVDPEQR